MYWQIYTFIILKKIFVQDGILTIAEHSINLPSSLNAWDKIGKHKSKTSIQSFLKVSYEIIVKNVKSALITAQQ